MDVSGQIEYWKTGSDEDLAAAESLLEKGHVRHGLFFAHLALEKMLKALVTRRTRDVPPRTHNLLRLATLAGLELGSEQEILLGRFDAYQLEGRYPDSRQIPVGSDLVNRELRAAMEMLRWLKQQLST